MAGPGCVHQDAGAFLRVDKRSVFPERLGSSSWRSIDSPMTTPLHPQEERH